MRVQALLAATILSTSIFSVPMSASAEGYGGPRTSYHDAQAAQVQCEQERNNRTATGAVIGGLAGVALGSGVASDGARTEGGLLAGLIGAVAGAALARGHTCDQQVSQNGYNPQTGRPYGTPYGRDPYDDGTGLAGGPGPERSRDCEWRDNRNGQPQFMCQDERGAWRPQ